VNLDISNNRISSLEPLSTLSRLQNLASANNCLPCLYGIASCSALNRLDASGNAISCLSDVAAVAACPLLGSLTLTQNPVRQVVDYRLHLVHLLPQVLAIMTACFVGSARVPFKTNASLHN
jgi:Leucine-rich repeat (LRR) protein